MHGCYSNKLNTTGKNIFKCDILGCVCVWGGEGSDFLYWLLFCHIVSVKQQFFFIMLDDEKTV